MGNAEQQLSNQKFCLKDINKKQIQYKNIEQNVHVY